MSPELRKDHDAEVSRSHRGVLDAADAAIAGFQLGEELASQGPASMQQVHEEHPEIEPRKYQAECLGRLAEVRAQGRDRALVHMATGLGKTTVAATDAKRFLAENPDARVLFLCHRNEILDQARSRFEHILGTESYTFGTYNGLAKDNTEATVLFASLQTMRTKKENFDPDTFDYVVVDESHHGKAESYEPTLRYFQPSFLLGLTATPDRGDLRDIREIFGHEVYSKTLTQALAERLLAQPDYRVILDDIQEGLLEREDLSYTELNKKLFIPKRDEEIARIISERAAETDSPRMLGFCASIAHAQIMAELLPGARAVHSQMRAGERRDVLDAFREGDVNALFTVDIFNEGIDIPDANIIVFLRSTESDTIFLQQLGRGLRKIQGKDDVLVLDFVANIDRLLMLESLLANTIRAVKQGGSGDSGDIEDGIWDDPLEYDELIDGDELAGDIVMIKELGLGRFEFTETTRKILDAVKRMSYETAREGWMYVGSIAEMLGINRKTVARMADELGITGINMAGKGHGKVGLYFSTEQVESIKRAAGTIQSAPDGWLSSVGLRKAHGLNPYTTASTAERLGISGTQMRGATGMRGIFYSPEEQERIVAAAKGIEQKQETWLTATALAKTNSLNANVVADAIGSLGLVGTK